MSASETHPANPYVGTRAYGENDPPLYGREAELPRLLDLLIAERIVLFYAPSGAGKTSLIQARLIPKLREEGFFVLPTVRVNTLAGTTPAAVEAGRDRYTRAVMQRLDAPLAPANGPPPPLPPALDLAAYLGQRPRPSDAPNLEVLVFDQFEEILTLDPTDGAEKEAFFAQVGAALRDRKRWALFAMREDHVAGLDPYLHFIPTRLGATFRIDLLGPVAARLAIQRPAADYGVAFANEAAQDLVDDLRQVRIQDQEGAIVEALGPHVEPVQLQVVCQRLWQMPRPDPGRIGDEQVRALGGVENALVRHYDGVVAAAAEAGHVDEYAIRLWCDEQLITEQGTRGQVQKGPDRTADLDNRAIDEMVRRHLLRPERRLGSIWFELAHDRLIRPVRRGNAAWYRRHLQTFQLQARLWDGQQHDDGHLLSRDALRQAEAWLRDHPGPLRPFERTFLDESRERDQQLRDHEEQALRRAQDRQQQAERNAKQQFRLRRVITVIGFISIFAALAAWMAALEASRARSDANEQAATNLQTAHANLAARLSAEEVPSLIANHQDNLAALLALQAYEFDQRSDGDGGERVIAALNGALAQEPFAHVLAERAAGPVRSVAYSPDGRLLASGGDDGQVRLWDVNSSQPQSAPPDEVGGGVLSLAFSPDGRLLAVGGCRNRLPDALCETGELQVWNLDDLEAQPRFPRVDLTEVRSVAFHPSRRLLAWGEMDGTVRVWDLDQASDVPSEAKDQTNQEAVGSVAFSPDGGVLAAGGCITARGTCRGTVVLFDPLDLSRTLDKLGEDALGRGDPEGPEELVRSVAFSPGGLLLAAGSGTEVWLWDRSGSGIRCPDTNGAVTRVSRACSWQHPGDVKKAITAVAFKPDGLLVSASYDNTIRFWDSRQPGDLRSTTNVSYPDVVLAQALRGGDEQGMATGSSDGIVRLWDFRRSSEPPSVLREHTNQVWSVAFNPDSTRPVMASAGLDGNVFLWDRQNTDSVPERLPLDSDPSGCHGADNDQVWSLAFSPDGERLAAGYGDGLIRVWDIGDRVLYALLHDNHHCNEVRSLAFSRDNRYLASGDWDGKVFVWDMMHPTGRPHALDPGPHRVGVVRALAFSPADDSLLAVGGCQLQPPDRGVCQSGGVVLLGDWHTAVAQVCCRGDDLNEAVYSVGFSPNGEQLAVGTLNGLIRLWRVADREPLGAPYTGHRFSVRSLVFLNEAVLISASDDGTVRRWDLIHRDTVPLILVSHPAEAPNCADADSPDGPNLCPVYSTTVSPDGKTVASGDRASRIRMSYIDPVPLVELVCKKVRRNPTQDEWSRHVGSGIPLEQVCPESLV